MAMDWIRSLLHMPAKIFGQMQINAAIHVAETIGRADDCISKVVENGTMIDRHVVYRSEEALPCRNNFFIDVC